MKRAFAIVLVAFAALQVPAATNDAPVKLAMVAESPDAAAVADMLTAEFTKNNQVQLLERTEIGKVNREQGLSAANKDYFKAVVSQNHAGLVQIGERYLNGQDAPKSAPKAWLWFSLAADKGVADATAKTSFAQSEMTKTELQDAKQLLPDFIKEFDSVTGIMRGTQRMNFNPRP